MNTQLAEAFAGVENRLANLESLMRRQLQATDAMLRNLQLMNQRHEVAVETATKRAERLTSSLKIAMGETDGE